MKTFASNEQWQQCKNISYMLKTNLWQQNWALDPTRETIHPTNIPHRVTNVTNTELNEGHLLSTANEPFTVLSSERIPVNE